MQLCQTDRLPWRGGRVDIPLPEEKKRNRSRAVDRNAIYTLRRMRLFRLVLTEVQQHLCAGRVCAQHSECAIPAPQECGRPPSPCLYTLCLCAVARAHTCRGLLPESLRGNINTQNSASETRAAMRRARRRWAIMGNGSAALLWRKGAAAGPGAVATPAEFSPAGGRCSSVRRTGADPGWD
ncbi:hypothetical protein NP493_915g00017 [Ridgeia piscesae]|uniref:Uncharacterized protein n=1 Tax=Ridgeia piscesae TaxID=27915 RepID=A0AAD9KM52_RIDPI|nr:hypothetical protein NP493_915g00017 [Ridgeia piscesae]